MAKQDAQQRMAHDAIGAAMPLAVTALAPVAALIPLVSGTSLAVLALLGGLAARRWRRSYEGERNGHVLGRTSDGADAGVGAVFGTVAWAWSPLSHSTLGRSETGVSSSACRIVVPRGRPFFPSVRSISGLTHCDPPRHWPGETEHSCSAERRQECYRRILESQIKKRQCR